MPEVESPVVHNGYDLEHESLTKARSVVVCGCMFGGKTEAVIKLVDIEMRKGKDVIIFKPQIDDRWGTNAIRSHSGREFEANEVDHLNPWQILKVIDRAEAILGREIQVVAIDEIQFFSRDVAEVVNHQLVDTRRKRVIAGGLQLDFRGETFGAMDELLTHADIIVQQHAVCEKCGDEEATRTQRIVNGKPAFYDDPIIMIGAEESYVARCRDCHEVPEKD